MSKNCGLNHLVEALGAGWCALVGLLREELPDCGLPSLRVAWPDVRESGTRAFRADQGSALPPDSRIGAAFRDSRAASVAVYARFVRAIYLAASSQITGFAGLSWLYETQPIPISDRLGLFVRLAGVRDSGDAVEWRSAMVSSIGGL